MSFHVKLYELGLIVHLYHFWTHNWRMIPNAYMLYGIIILKKNNIKSLIEKRRGKGQEQGSAMAALKSRSMNGTVASLKMRRTKRNCFHSSAHRYPRMLWVENSSWVPDLRLCSLTDHVMSQRFSHATIHRQILGFFCIWHLTQNMAIQKHMSAQWTVMSWCWLSGFLSLLAYQSFGWALVQDKIIVTFQYIPSAPISVH